MNRARELRHNPTDAERALWRRLRQRLLAGHRFRRQHPLGPYIVDFFCFQKGLAIEVDGGQHSERTVYDAQRTAWLEAQGYRVLRFWNNEVIEEMEGVEETILEALAAD